MKIEMTNELKVVTLLSGFVRELNEGKRPYEELNFEYAERIAKLFSLPDNEISIEKFFEEQKGITVDAARNVGAKYTAIDICKFAKKYYEKVMKF